MTSNTKSQRSHDQRKGQWLINAIRFSKDFPKIDYSKWGDFDMAVKAEKAMVEIKLWNMTNSEFDKIMEDYNK